MILSRHNIPDVLAREPVITDLGRIADPKGFSRRHVWADPLKTDITVRQYGGPLKFDGVPPNFLPVLEQAIEVHDADTREPTSCMILFNQGTLQPERNFRVIEPHIDPEIFSYPDNPAVLEDSFIISDALTTVFYKQAFDAPASGYLEDIYWQLSETFRKQAKPECRFIPEPHHLVRFSAYAVHESQLAKVATDRTFALVRFF